MRFIVCLAGVMAACSPSQLKSRNPSGEGKVATSIARVTSGLWGEHGEKWDRSRLPDFTSAGYKGGSVPIPNYSNQINVKDFGAIGDGQADDSSVFIAALEKCKDGQTIYVPPGLFRITHVLSVNQDRCLIRGAGENKTTLLFEKGLEELHPRYANGQTDWSWSGALIIFDGVKESGVENLTIQFPDKPWDGHNFHERGYNAVGFKNQTTDCWLKNLTIIGADLGIWIEETAHHITADRWTLKFGPKRAAQKISCHHAINVYGHHNLIGHFEIDGICQHDLSVESGNAHHNVFSKGKGANLSFDHHSEDYEQRYNLFTEIDIGEGTRMYLSGGNRTPRGVSFYETWWNIQSALPVKWVTSMGPSKNNNIVGIHTKLPSVLGDSDGNWFEAIPPTQLFPQNLYEAQLEFVSRY